GSRDASKRHATLRASIDASWDLLAPWERDALAQCSVFRGGFTAPAAAGVLDLSAHPDAPDTMDVLDSLQEKSLLYLRRPIGGVGDPRFGLYVGIREYAAERLETSPLREVVERRHSEYFVETGEGMARACERVDSRLWSAALALERENLEQVVARAVAGAP